MNNRRQIVITHLQQKTIMLYMENEKIYDVLVGEKEGAQSIEVGDIYIGRVQNIVQNINAAFVEIQKGIVCYLPLSECGDRKIQCGNELVVQIKKSAVKTKQPVVTLYPELAGKYSVIQTKTSRNGISKKIKDQEKILELQQLLGEYETEEYGILLRTNAADAPLDEIRSECQKLSAEMHEKMEHSRYMTCFSLLRKETPFYMKYINSCRPDDLDRVITDDEEIFHQLYPVCGSLAEWYQDTAYPLDKLLGISSKLEKAFEKYVWLKSGGSLVIEPTEALTVIDVNTGKAIDGKRNRETTFFRINCEAAREAARQIRMRNLSGIILIDFIDMKNRKNQRDLMALLGEELAADKTRTALVDITKLGLVEITRMKKNRPLWETLERPRGSVPD